ncbi:MAG: hypothetical protein EOP85_10815 [Verrucomicrobiaceae bacterium]|nr:MAG: hypothetical protein EOP85_10815 [Verrucomicrobiaceae bacterium]
MIRPLSIFWITAAASLWAADADLLRFVNGDQLHGSFEGIKEGPAAVWKRDDVAAAVEFKTDQLRHIVLRGGRPIKPLSSLSHVGLVNGDRVPGTLVALDASTFTLETGYAGTLRIPRDQVAMFAPSPLGGRLHYHGPFREDEWRMANASFPDGMPPRRRRGRKRIPTTHPGARASPAPRGIGPARELARPCCGKVPCRTVRSSVSTSLGRTASPLPSASTRTSQKR